jgi:hypothetical protein
MSREAQKERERGRRRCGERGAGPHRAWCAPNQCVDGDGHHHQGRQVTPDKPQRGILGLVGCIDARVFPGKQDDRVRVSVEAPADVLELGAQLADLMHGGEGRSHADDEKHG